MSTQSSADYKIDKNGRKYPARRVKVSSADEISEASYKGNIGIMELIKFHKNASPEDKKKFNDLMKKKASGSDIQQRKTADQIWDHVQRVTGMKLQAMESNQFSFKDFIGSEFLKEQKEIELLNSLELLEKKLTSNELKKREEIALAIEKQFPDMNISKKMAIATATAKKVTESKDKIVLKLPKPRDPNHTVLVTKKNAAGKHRDKKREDKQGIKKHKSERFDSDFL